MSSDAAVPGIIQSGRRVLAQYRLDRVMVADRVATPGPGGVVHTYVTRTHVDDDGDTVETWFPCRFGQVTGFGRITDKEAQAVLDAVMQEKSAQAVQFHEDMVIGEQDRVIQPDGKEWVVVAELTPRSVMRTMVRVVVREV